MPQGAPLEEKTIALQCTAAPVNWKLATRFSSWPKLLRVTAYVLKFVQLCRRSKLAPISPTGNAAWSAIEIGIARVFWLKRVQAELFPSEIHALTCGRGIAPRSPLGLLNPFLDDELVLRVGGRLRQAPFSTAVRYPVLHIRL